MRILLTNDDGYGKAGLMVLAEALRAEHEVWVVAPDGERSACSHSFTVRGPVCFRRVTDRHFACSGTPVDCVYYSLSGAIDFKPDLVASGINNGPNLGSDLVYSGTAAAARQAAMHGIPGIALSLAAKSGNSDYGPAAAFFLSHLGEIISLWRPGSFISINFPNRPDLPAEFSLATLCQRSYRDVLHSFVDPEGQRYCFLKGELIDVPALPGNDDAIVHAGGISLSLVDAQMHCSGVARG